VDDRDGIREAPGHEGYEEVGRQGMKWVVEIEEVKEKSWEWKGNNSV